MNNKSVLVIAEQENFDYYHAIPWERRVVFHPLDGPIRSIRQEDLGLILIDCGFDGSRGLGLLHDIKTAHSDVPVILITDAGSEETAIMAFRLGARDYFRKPVHLFELRGAMEKLLKMRGANKEKRTRIQTAIPAAVTERYFPTVGDVPPPILRMITYVKNHLTKAVTIDQLAGVAGVSRFHFCRTFRKAMGMSPMSFVALMRVERGKTLLRKEIPVLSVAHMAGFKELSSFNRHFKRLTGLTPSAYRDSLKQ